MPVPRATRAARQRFYVIQGAAKVTPFLYFLSMKLFVYVLTISKLKKKQLFEKKKQLFENSDTKTVYF